MKSKGSFIDGYVRFRKVVEAVSNVTGIKEDDILGRRRMRPIVDARHMAIRLLRIKSNLNLTNIGGLFDRDHTSVIHALSSSQDMMDMDLYYRKEFEQIVNEYDRIMGELQSGPVEEEPVPFPTHPNTEDKK